MSADRTKSRKAMRAAAFNKEQQSAPPAPKRGRPAIGHRRLCDKPLAREAVIYNLMINWAKWTPRRAAAFAAAVGCSSVEIEPTETSKADGFSFKFKYTAGDRSQVQGKEYNALNHRRDKILQYAPALIGGATGDDEIWLQLAMQALQRYFTALFKLDPDAIRAAEDLLRSPEIGWPAGSRAKLFLKDERYQRVKIELIDT